jgi:uncharacterized OsmC-like protein
MSEKVLVRQKNNYETEFHAADPEAPGSDKLEHVRYIQDLTPYGMLLAGLASCTAVVVNTYAQYHGVKLDEVELIAEYQRTFKEDCKHCEEISQYDEQISLDMSFKGDLSPQDHEKLFKISLQCPIHKMFKSGIKVQTRLAGDKKFGQTAAGKPG